MSDRGDGAPTPAAATQRVEMRLSKATKNKVVFKSDDPSAAVDVLYVAKESVPKGCEAIAVSIEFTGRS